MVASTGSFGIGSPPGTSLCLENFTIISLQHIVVITCAKQQSAAIEVHKGTVEIANKAPLLAADIGHCLRIRSVPAYSERTYSNLVTGNMQILGPRHVYDVPLVLNVILDLDQTDPHLPRWIF